MSEDRIQRQIEFIVEQQAKFVVDIAELRQGLAEMKESQERASVETRKNIDSLSERVTNLADALLSLTNIVEKQGDHIVALAERGKETDARLNTLIAIVERHITNPDAHK
jgi:phage-related minor tail protein